MTKMLGVLLAATIALPQVTSANDGSRARSGGDVNQSTLHVLRHDLDLLSQEAGLGRIDSARYDSVEAIQFVITSVRIYMDLKSNQNLFSHEILEALKTDILKTDIKALSSWARIHPNYNYAVKRRGYIYIDRDKFREPSEDPMLKFVILHMRLIDREDEADYKNSRLYLQWLRQKEHEQTN